MSKQIIVGGVDISECGHSRVNASLFNEKILVQCSAFFLENEDSCCECSDNPNCYYKQLKRKEQECEELKGRLKYIINENKMLKDCATDEHIDIVALKNYISTLEFHNDQLKAENEELKKEIVNRNEKIKELRFSVSDLTNRLCDLNAEKPFRIVDLEQTLTEIKKIALGVRNYLDYPSPRDVKDVRYEMGIILQKISEAIK